MKQHIVPGSIDQSIIVFLQDSREVDGSGLTGLVYNTASLVCYYVRPGSAAAQLSLATQTVTGAHSNGGFVEIDATNLPGFYRLDLSDALAASGVGSVALMIRGAANLVGYPAEIQLSRAPADATAISGDSTAADNLEAMLDGTGAVLTLSQLRIAATGAEAGIYVTNIVGAGVTIDGDVNDIVADITGTISTVTTVTDGAKSATALSNATWTDAKAAFLDHSIDTVDGVVDSILLDTGTDGVALSTAVKNAIADAYLGRVNGIETGVTPKQAQQRIGAVVAGKISGAGTGTEVFVGMDGSTTRVTETIDASGNRSAVAYDG